MIIIVIIITAELEASGGRQEKGSLVSLNPKTQFVRVLTLMSPSSRASNNHNCKPFGVEGLGVKRVMVRTWTVHVSVISSGGGGGEGGVHQSSSLESSTLV
jgi:hypothetical protein